MKVENTGSNANSQAVVVHTCPSCNIRTRFEPIGSDFQISTNMNHVCGHRYCPNCKEYLFVGFEGKVLKHSYPPLRINFDASDVPARIVQTFSEALGCHSHSHFTSSAIMVRRTLEEICADRGASGKDLKDRIRDLRGKVILPPELFDAMDELRLLGNDAAHLEARYYDDIGTEELQVAIEFCKEILKAVYQYKGLLSKFQALKKPAKP